MFRRLIGAGVALALAVFALAEIGMAASGQEALPRDYGYKLADRTPEASYFLSGIKRGAEPESIEAWVWTVMPSSAGADNEPYDAKAQLSVLRCTGKSIEPIRTEFYFQGRFIRSVEVPPLTPADVKPGTPMAPIWQIACDMSFRFNARSIQTLDEAYAVTRGK